MVLAHVITWRTRPVPLWTIPLFPTNWSAVQYCLSTRLIEPINSPVWTAASWLRALCGVVISHIGLLLLIILISLSYSARVNGLSMNQAHSGGHFIHPYIVSCSAKLGHLPLNPCTWINGKVSRLKCMEDQDVVNTVYCQLLSMVSLYIDSA